mgnify:CR=1 FL=1
MKILVTVKQVPDTSGKVSVKPDGTLDRASMATITNPDDLNALEAALKLKDATGCEVVVVTMGPPPAEGMLRELLARGADKAVLVSGREFGGSDTFATSQILAAAVNKIGVGPEDVVFCGRQAIDGDTAQVGPAIAEHLTIPHAAWVAEIVDVNEKAIQVRQDLVSVSQISEIPYPCLLTIDKDTCVPRLPSYLLKKATADRPIRILSFEDMPDQDLSRYGLVGSPTSVERMFAPPEGEKQVYLEGGAKEKAEELFSILTGKKII